MVTFDPNQPEEKLAALRSGFQKMAELVPNDAVSEGRILTHDSSSTD